MTSTAGFCWSPDGNRLVTSEYFESNNEDAPIRVWDWRNEKVVAIGPAGKTPVAWRHEYNQVLFQSDAGITLWDIGSKQTVRDFYGHSSVTDLACSPDGQRFVSTGYDHTVRTWSVESRAPIRQVKTGARNDDLDWDPTGAT